MVRNNVSLFLMFLLPSSTLLQRGCDSSTSIVELEVLIEVRSALSTLNERMNYLQDKVEDMATSLQNKLTTVDSKVEKNIKAVTENIKSLQTEYQKVNKVVENKFNMQDSESNSGIKEELKQVKDLITNQIEKQTLHGKLNDIKDKLLNVEKQLNNKRTLDEEVHFFKSQLKDKTDNFTIEIHECKHLPGDCKDVQERGYKESGIYRIQPRLSNDSFLVWCDMMTRGGGWVSVLKRVDGSQDFYLNWNEYKNGFGSLPGEHWVGLDHLSELTNSQRNELLVELVDWDLKNVSALYDSFIVGNESTGYVLESLGDYTGDAGDSMANHLGKKFSTLDRDQDENADKESCSVFFQAGWWFKNCYFTLLTGRYVKPKPGVNYQYKSTIKWKDFHGYNYSLKAATMLIRPIYV
ncbi:fibrinogen-like protein 1 isoform X1 [Zophobas morio]|uniref:fibrinogen-like protein 1 isoform X1 n=1 Tax=Zophobas morio TaxID=2755281 RepID=UPI0030838766